MFITPSRGARKLSLVPSGLMRAAALSGLPKRTLRGIKSPPAWGWAVSALAGVASVVAAASAGAVSAAAAVLSEAVVTAALSLSLGAGGLLGSQPNATSNTSVSVRNRLRPID